MWRPKYDSKSPVEVWLKYGCFHQFGEGGGGPTVLFVHGEGHVFAPDFRKLPYMILQLYGAYGIIIQAPTVVVQANPGQMLLAVAAKLLTTFCLEGLVIVPTWS